MCCYPCILVYIEHSLDQIFGVRRDIFPIALGILYLTLCVFPQQFVLIRASEHWSSRQHDVEDDSSAKNIRLHTVPKTIQNLRSNIARRTTL